jgi:hypothetical protein
MNHLFALNKSLIWYEDLQNAFFNIATNYQHELDLYTVAVLCVADSGGW